MAVEIVDLEEEKKPEKRVDKKKKARRRRRASIALISVFAFLVVSYVTFVFIPIPFVRYWRNIYIETAMSTNSHQWLATMFIPGFIIDEVMADVYAQLDSQKDVESTWEDADDPIIEPPVAEEKEEDVLSAFFEKYWEVATPSVKTYLEKHQIDTEEELDSLLISDLEENLQLKTVEGDSLLALDVKNELILIGIRGTDYVGKLAIVKDPSLVEMGKSRYLGSRGEIIDGFGENYDAVLAVNASGFKDVEGHGSGGEIKGSLVIDGVEYGRPEAAPSTYKFIGMQFDGKFYVANPWNVNVADYKWGMQFFPALVVDGECIVAGTYGLGIQPRTTVGQTQDGSFIMLVVDGRQIGYSLGCTMEECANQMIKYGVYQAANLDGGSSSIMWYDGSQITKSSSPSGFGRYLPNAIYIKKVH